eukprot:TRINITY_DN3206_c0_g1_i1.p1 TRINITY_DN3206_c0_g1~~TRINITY_DN3206_c0_g1_i1.p1  ORF type:complete len:857 (-),score=160.94 TRINITY_DN3206_c0_g1_i1:20-2590(-)
MMGPQIIFFLICTIASSVSQPTHYTGYSGDWFDSSNWSNGVPNSNSDAYILITSVPAINSSIPVLAKSLTINVNVTVTFQAGVSITTLDIQLCRVICQSTATFGEATIGNTSSLEFYAPSTVQRVSLNAPLLTSASLLVSAGELNVTTSFFATSNFLIGSSIKNTSNIPNLNLLQGCTSNFQYSGGPQRNLQYVNIVNYGIINYSLSSLYTQSGIIINQIGGIFNGVATTATATYTGQFENYGTVNGSSSVGLSFSTFNNYGNVIATAGQISFDGGDHNGTLGASAGSFSFTGYTNFNAGTTVNGGPNFTISSGATVNFRSPMVISRLTANQATINFYGGTVITGPMISSNNVIIWFRGNTTVGTLATNSTYIYIFANVCVDNLIMVGGVIQLATSLRINKSWQYSNGSINPDVLGSPAPIIVIGANATANITGSIKLSSLTVNNFGIVDYSAKSDWGYYAVWVNHPNSVFNIFMPSQAVVIDNDQGSFNNYGLVKINCSKMTFEADVLNFGTFDVGNTTLVIDHAYLYQYAGVLTSKNYIDGWRFYMHGGYLDASGSIAEMDHFGGVIRPGGPNAIGRIVFLDSYDQGNLRNLTSAFQLEAQSATNYDTIHIAGTWDSVPTAITFEMISPYVAPVGTNFSGVFTGFGYSSSGYPAVMSKSYQYVYEWYEPLNLIVNSTMSSTTCGACANGYCVGSACKCFDGYGGANCSSFACGWGCGLGTCVGSNNCQCPEGRYGFRCEFMPSGCLTNSTASAPVTTRALTTSSLTTSRLTTSPLTTSRLTTSPLTTSALTTSKLTTSKVSTGAAAMATGNSVTASSEETSLSSGEATSSPTTKDLTSTGSVSEYSSNSTTLQI